METAASGKSATMAHEHRHVNTAHTPRARWNSQVAHPNSKSARPSTQQLIYPESQHALGALTDDRERGRGRAIDDANVHREFGSGTLAENGELFAQAPKKTRRHRASRGFMIKADAQAPVQGPEYMWPQHLPHGVTPKHGTPGVPPSMEDVSDHDIWADREIMNLVQLAGGIFSGTGTLDHAIAARSAYSVTGEAAEGIGGQYAPGDHAIAASSAYSVTGEAAEGIGGHYAPGGASGSNTFGGFMAPPYTQHGAPSHEHRPRHHQPAHSISNLKNPMDDVLEHELWAEQEIENMANISANMFVSGAQVHDVVESCTGNRHALGASRSSNGVDVFAPPHIKQEALTRKQPQGKQPQPQPPPQEQPQEQQQHLNNSVVGLTPAIPPALSGRGHDGAVGTVGTASEAELGTHYRTGKHGDRMNGAHHPAGCKEKVLPGVNGGMTGGKFQNVSGGNKDFTIHQRKPLRAKRAARKRGPYHCTKCGQRKLKHVCRRKERPSKSQLFGVQTAAPSASTVFDTCITPVPSVSDVNPLSSFWDRQ